MVKSKSRRFSGRRRNAGRRRIRPRKSNATSPWMLQAVQAFKTVIIPVLTVTQPGAAITVRMIADAILAYYKFPSTSSRTYEFGSGRKFSFYTYSPEAYLALTFQPQSYTASSTKAEALSVVSYSLLNSGSDADRYKQMSDSIYRPTVSRKVAYSNVSLSTVQSSGNGTAIVPTAGGSSMARASVQIPARLSNCYSGAHIHPTPTKPNAGSARVFATEFPPGALVPDDKLEYGSIKVKVRFNGDGSRPDSYDEPCSNEFVSILPNFDSRDIMFADFIAKPFQVSN